MCKGLEDMMAEKLEEGLERGIKAFVEACQELQVSKEDHEGIKG